MQTTFNKGNLLRRRQTGAITMISAVLILILLTEMIIYGVQTGVFEQRKSSNELRQKQAFHMADSAVQEAKAYMLLNSRLISSSSPDLLEDGSDGWLPGSGAPRWWPCAGITDKTHPCFAESNEDLRGASYFFGIDGDGDDSIDEEERKLPLDPLGLATAPSDTEQANLYALLCMLEFVPEDERLEGEPIVKGCTTVTDEQDYRYFMVTLAARGNADCINNANCKAEAMVSEKIGSFGPGGGGAGPGVPLVARTAVPLSGTVEIVPNPNGGGIGVPISTWINANDDPDCEIDGEPIDPQSGSYATCERHEWYGVDSFPEDYKCPDKDKCHCDKNEDKLLSYAAGGERFLGIDVVVDPNFPCDIFKYTFGIPKTDYLKVKELVPTQNRLSSCDSLDENSFGVYWISGRDCVIQSSTTVGSVKAPVFLISAAKDTTIHGDMFGILFVTDAENPDAGFKGNGHGNVYGAAIMDAEMDQFNGTFAVVYLENVINQAMGSGEFGGVQGGWTDFHQDWH